MHPIFYDAFLPYLPLLLSFMVLGIIGAFMAPAESTKRAAVGLTLVVIAVAGALSSSFAISTSTDKSEQDARLAEVQRVYGLDISNRDFYELKYPLNLPSDNFRTYGTATVTTEKKDGGLAQRRLTLVWKDGEFRLFQGEGAITTLEELPRPGR